MLFRNHTGEVYADAICVDLANAMPFIARDNIDGSGQIGFIVFVMDATGNCAPLTFKSRKCKRIVHSAMAAECCAFADAADAGFVAKVELERVLGRSVPLEALTGDKHVCQTIATI